MDFELVKCVNCELVYTYFRRDVEISPLYNEGAYRLVDNRDSLWDKILAVEYGKVVRWLRGRYPSGGALLDFGCGKGKFLDLASHEGWEVKGVETSVPRAEFARTNYNLDISSEAFKGGRIFDRRFDVITMFHVLEHLPRPSEVISSLLRENLSEDGTLIIEVPNLQSVQARIAKGSWIHLDLPKHLSHFTRMRLSKFLMSEGLKIEREEYFSLHNGLLGMAHALLITLGYSGNMIYELKNSPNKRLLFGLTLVSVPALLVEFTASLFRAGGVVRFYCRRTTNV